MTKPQPYPEYKYAGVPWLDDVPESWPVVSTRVALRPIKVLAGTDPSKHQLLSLTKQGVIPRDMENAQGKHPENYDTYQVVDIDDLIFCLFDIDETPRTVGLVKKPGMLTGAYTRFKTTSAANPRFICWYFLALDNDKRLKPLYTGLRKVIQNTRFLSAPMPLPELKVQRAIADFLDHETAQIDDLIGKQERLLKLLAEKRQAVITHAVTKGLDPTAPTKSTGIPWLGDIPAHWKLSPVKHFYDIALGKMLQREQEVETDTFRPFLKAASIKSGKVAYSEDNQMWFSHNEVKTLSLREGDILVVEGGSIGQSALVEHDIPNAGFEKSLNRVRPRAGSSSEYFQLYMTMARESGYVAMQCVGTTFMHLTSEKLGRMIMPVPPPTEQVTIAHEVGKILDRLTDASDRALSLVNLLRERRSALISAAVTGRIDVTNEGVAA